MSGPASARRDLYKGHGGNTGHHQGGGKGHKGHGKHHRRHKKEDPCLALPVAPGTPTMDFINREHRHHPWWGRVTVADVTTDVDGLLLSVPPRRYCIQVKRKRIGAGSDEPDIQQFYIWNRENDTSGNTTKLFHCHKGWQYSARARAETGLLTKADRSAWSNWSVYQNVTETLFPARNVTVSAVSPRRIAVKWDPPRNLNNIDHVGLDLYRVEFYQGATLKETIRTRAEHHRFTVDEGDKTKSFNAKVYAIDENAEESAAASSGNVNESGNFTAVPAGDGVIPANPANVYGEGIQGAIRVWWDPTVTVQNDPVTYDVYLGTTAGFTPSAANQVGSTSGFQMLIVRAAGNSPLLTTPIGSTTNPYYVKVRARDLFDGPQTGFVSATGAPFYVRGQYSDGSVPASSPAANVIAEATGLKVSWNGIVNADPVTYEVHVSTSAGFNPTAGDVATLFGLIDGTQCVVTKVPPMTPGADLVGGTTYYVRIIARDFDGPAAAAGTVGSGTVLYSQTDGQVPLALVTVSEVTGGVGWIRAKWPTVTIGVRGTGANPEPCSYDVYVKDGSAPTGVAGELVDSDVRADYCYIRASDSSGTPLAYGHTYYVGVKTRDPDGRCATLGGTASGKMLNVTHEDIAVDAVRAENIQALSIDASKLSSAVILGTKRIVGGASDTVGVSRVVMDASGIKFLKGDGTNDTAVIEMKTIDGSARFTGDVSATSLAAPGATFDGAVAVTKNGGVSLASAQGPPNIPLALTQDVATNAWNDSAGDGGDRSSMWFDGTNYWYISERGDMGQHGHYAVKLNASGVEQSATLLLADSNGFYTFFGIVKVGTFWYILGYNENTGNAVWRSYADISGTPSTSTTNSGIFSDWRGFHRFAFTTDGTYIYVAQSNQTAGGGGTNQLWAARFTVASGNGPALDGTRQLSDTSGARFDTAIESLYVGNGDFGTPKWVVTLATQSTAYLFTFTFNTSLIEDVANRWPLAETASGSKTGGSSGGVTYIGTGFAQFCETVQYLYTALAGATYYVAYTWYDNNATGGTHESSLGPMKSLVMNARWRMLVSWPPIPSGGTDDPNRVRIYMNDAAPADATVFANYFRQGASFNGTSTSFTTYSEATTGAQGTAFVAAGGATLTTQQGGFSLNGLGLLVLPQGAGNPPVAGVEAAAYYDTTDDVAYNHNGQAWTPLGSGFAGGHTEKAANQTGVAQATQTVVTFPAPTFVSHSTLWDATNNKWVIPTGYGGIWRFLCCIQWEVPATNHVDKTLRLTKNIAGTPVVLARAGFTTGGTINQQNHMVECVASLVAGDTVSAEATSGSAAAADQRLMGDLVGKTWFEAHYLGPLAQP